VSENSTESLKDKILNKQNMKYVAAFFAGMLVALLFSGAAHSQELKNFNYQIEHTNFIVAERCSGTLINERMILTNFHCITPNLSQYDVDIVDPDTGEVKKVKRERKGDLEVAQRSYDNFSLVSERKYVAEILAYKKERDLAILRIKDASFSSEITTKVAPESVSVGRGDPVYAVGNPAMLDATVTYGVVSSLQRKFRAPWAGNEEIPFIQFDAGIVGGSSGGALYNKDGILIGVPAAGMPGTAIGLAIPGFEIRKFLDEQCMRSVYVEDKKFDEECAKKREERKKKNDE
jgi:S1-C subfamily serine protease